jgi:urease accessory protein
MKKILSLFSCFLLLLLPTTAFAHVGAGTTSRFAHGFNHPIAGLDHLLAMVAVGLWAAQIGGRAVWAVPATFVLVMGMGGILGMSHVGLPLVEQGILGSVLILGVLIAAAVRLPLMASVAIVALFALCHGHAHGTEMPDSISGLSYGLGFILATSLLHFSGLGLGMMIQKFSRPVVTRWAGGVLALAGLYLALS